MFWNAFMVTSKLPCFERKHCKNMQTNFKKYGIWRILWKKMLFGQFSGDRRRGYLKFPSLGGPHGGETIKKHPLGGSQGGGEIVALDGPGCGWLRSFLK